jgi:hypothetical protein
MLPRPNGIGSGEGAHENEDDEGGAERTSTITALSRPRSLHALHLAPGLCARVVRRSHPRPTAISYHSPEEPHPMTWGAVSAGPQPSSGSAPLPLPISVSWTVLGMNDPMSLRSRAGVRGDVVCDDGGGVRGVWGVAFTLCAEAALKRILSGAWQGKA